jgi:hypothetical protein
LMFDLPGVHGVSILWAGGVWRRSGAPRGHYAAGCGD